MFRAQVHKTAFTSHISGKEGSQGYPLFQSVLSDYKIYKITNLETEKFSFGLLFLRFQSMVFDPVVLSL